MPSQRMSHMVTSLVWGRTKGDLAGVDWPWRRLVLGWETAWEPLRNGRAARGEFR